MLATGVEVAYLTVANVSKGVICIGHHSRSMAQETETGHFELTGRRVLLAFVALFVVPPIVLQPVRPVLVDIVPQPTLWQSVALLLGQVLLFVLAVRWWTLRQRLAALDAAQPTGGATR